MPSSIDAFERFLSDFGLTSLRSSGSVPSPTLTLAVANKVEQNEAPKTSEPSGPFEVLLGGHVEVLFEDMETHPHGYDDEALGLVDDLVRRPANARSLTEDERAALDRATVHFASK